MQAYGDSAAPASVARAPASRSSDDPAFRESVGSLRVGWTTANVSSVQIFEGPPF